MPKVRTGAHFVSAERVQLLSWLADENTDIDAAGAVVIGPHGTRVPVAVLRREPYVNYGREYLARHTLTGNKCERAGAEELHIRCTHYTTNSICLLAARSSTQSRSRAEAAAGHAHRRRHSLHAPLFRRPPVPDPRRHHDHVQRRGQVVQTQPLTRPRPC